MLQMPSSRNRSGSAASYRSTVSQTRSTLIRDYEWLYTPSRRPSSIVAFYPPPLKSILEATTGAPAEEVVDEKQNTFWYGSIQDLSPSLQLQLSCETGKSPAELQSSKYLVPAPAGLEHWPQDGAYYKQRAFVVDDIIPHDSTLDGIVRGLYNRGIKQAIKTSTIMGAADVSPSIIMTLTGQSHAIKSSTLALELLGRILVDALDKNNAQAYKVKVSALQIDEFPTPPREPLFQCLVPAAVSANSGLVAPRYVKVKHGGAGSRGIRGAYSDDRTWHWICSRKDASNLLTHLKQRAEVELEVCVVYTVVLEARDRKAEVGARSAGNSQTSITLEAEFRPEDAYRAIALVANPRPKNRNGFWVTKDKHGLLNQSKFPGATNLQGIWIDSHAQVSRAHLATLSRSHKVIEALTPALLHAPTITDVAILPDPRTGSKGQASAVKHAAWALCTLAKTLDDVKVKSGQASAVV